MGFLDGEDFRDTDFLSILRNFVEGRVRSANVQAIALFAPNGKSFLVPDSLSRVRVLKFLQVVPADPPAFVVEGFEEFNDLGSQENLIRLQARSVRPRRGRPPRPFDPPGPPGLPSG